MDFKKEIKLKDLLPKRGSKAAKDVPAAERARQARQAQAEPPVFP